MVADLHAVSRRNRKRSMRCRAWLNGVEVTSRCYYADSKRGIVRLLVLNDAGKPFYDPVKADAAREECRGKVVIQERR